MTNGDFWKRIRNDEGVGVIEIILVCAVIAFAIFKAI